MVDAGLGLGLGLDWILRRASGVAARLGPPPATAALSALRKRVAARVHAANLTELHDVHARIGRGDSSARMALSALGDRAVSDMRHQVAREAAAAGLLARASAALDGQWTGSDKREHIDNPDLDVGLRTQLMEHLDSMNEVLASYHSFLDHMLPLLRTDGVTRILDLAAGHGGFALAAARDAAERGLAVEFTASDLKREYLDIGEGRARSEGLPVRFVVQDALDLSNLDRDEYDIIVCTQSLHHFPPGFVAVMFEQACRAAARGVVFIDGCRSAMVGLALGTYTLLRYLNSYFTHDAWVSCRRFYVPEELGLLACMASPGLATEARWVTPGHCLMRAESPGNACGRPLAGQVMYKAGS